uniref:Striatin n=1 Tax=Latimeria chalumnae TaxID=7897 RepID=H3B5I5_LATCH
EKEDQCSIPEGWEVDQGLLTKLKEQYKKERKGKKGVKRPNRSKLQDMLANLRDVDELPPLQPAMTPPSRPSTSRLNEHEINRTDEGNNVYLTVMLNSFKNDLVKQSLYEAMESELGLGELAGLTVANEADILTYDIANNKDALRKTWNPKFTLRSHFDGIRGLAFHPVEPVLITASEDHTLKMWNLQKTAPAKKSASLDIEPIYTFRAHRGSVLCVVMSSNGEQCYSGGIDGSIQCWNTPNPNTDPYDSYVLDASILRGALLSHTDSVWGLVYSGAHQRLLSCSADGTVRLWNTSEIAPCLSIFNENRDGMSVYKLIFVMHVIISLLWHQIKAKFKKNFINNTCYFSIGLSILLCLVILSVSKTKNSFFFLLFHCAKNLQLLVYNTFLLTNMFILLGKLIHSMVAHLDAVTSLAVDPNGLYLMSGSHDCSIRLWNLESKTCIQEFTAHRKKFDESIHDVAFHPSKCYIASAGADALAKVFV